MDAWKYLKLFLVLKRISHSFALLTHEISWLTLEIHFIFPPSSSPLTPEVILK